MMRERRLGRNRRQVSDVWRTPTALGSLTRHSPATIFEGGAIMAFTLPPLPFDRSALEPVLSPESFDLHHGKHHQAYVDKVNGWIDEKGLAGKSLVEVIRLGKDRDDRPLANNAGQIWS